MELRATSKAADLLENMVNSVESTLSQLGVGTSSIYLGDILNNV
jgi:hypothetical protein